MGVTVEGWLGDFREVGTSCRTMQDLRAATGLRRADASQRYARRAWNAPGFADTYSVRQRAVYLIEARLDVSLEHPVVVPGG